MNVSFYDDKFWEEGGQIGRKHDRQSWIFTVVMALGSILQTVFRLQHKQFWSEVSHWSKRWLIQIYSQLLPKETK